MLGERVRERREALKLTQDQVAAASGLKQFHISRIESGSIKDVKGDTIVKLALALDVSADVLLGIAAETAGRKPAPPTKRSRPRKAARVG